MQLWHLPNWQTSKFLSMFSEFRLKLNKKLRKWHLFHYFLDYFFENFQKYIHNNGIPLVKWPMNWSNKCVFGHKITNSSLKIKSCFNRHVPMTFKINNQPNWKVHAILIERENLLLVYHCISRHATLFIHKLCLATDPFQLLIVTHEYMESKHSNRRKNSINEITTKN